MIVIMKTKNVFINKVVFLLFLIIMIAGNAYAQSFTKIDTSIVCTAGGNSQFSSWADMNNDGLEDLIVINGNAETTGAFSHYLFINNGNWKFTRISDSPVVSRTTINGSRSAAWGDYDNDGYVDLFIDYFTIPFPSPTNQLFKNNGDGTFSEITEGDIVHDWADSGPSSWIDLDNDGYLDLYVTNKRMYKSFVYRNNGDGTFTRLTEGLLANFIYHLDYGPAWSDFDNDGDLDGFGTSFYIPKRYLLVNEGSGNFVFNETSGLTVDEEATWGWFLPSWGDYNNDGWQDVFIATWSINWGSDYDLLYRNNGDGTFTRVTGIAPVESKNMHEGGWWGDLDNDGYLDLIVSTYYGSNANKVYMNNGDGTFTAVTNIDFAKDRGGYINMIDINNDGFLDLFVARGYEGSFNNLLYANDGNSNAWLTVKPVGTISNKSAIGTKIRAKANIGGVDMWQIREMGLAANGFNAHFGLGNATQIDSLVIQWPSGIDTVLTHINVNQHLVITEPVPSGYIKASFTYDTAFGRRELEVHFRDISRHDPEKPVTSWSWDFDGDGTEDSDEQNPVYIFSNPDGASYTVTLRVSNGMDTAEMVKKDIIRLQKNHPGFEDNLSQWAAAVTASSSYAGYWLPVSAVDNEINSHWRSNSGHDEWLKVELDTIYDVGKVVINWEKMYGTNYEIYTSLDDENWDIVYCNYEGNGDYDTIYFTGMEARFVKLAGVKSSSSGFIVTEFEIYQSDGQEYASNCAPSSIVNTERSEGITVYPNPMTDMVTFSFNLQYAADIQLVLYDMTGRKITEVYNGHRNAGYQTISWNRKDLASGTYFYEIKIKTPNQIQQYNGKLLVME
jgi:PKD repeat protein